jgi:hypothetical protein
MEISSFGVVVCSYGAWLHVERMAGFET